MKLSRSLLGLVTICSISLSSLANAETPISDNVTFKKDFVVSVFKEPVIGVDIPEEEVVDIEVEEIITQDIFVSGDDPNGTVVTNAPEIPVGDMQINTSSNHCQATITTNNGFKLVGKEKGATLAEYELLYTSGTTTVESTITFGNNYAPTQIVECDTAALDMRVIRAFGSTPQDTYDDVIRLSIEAES